MHGGKKGQGRSERTSRGQEQREVMYTEGEERRREVMDPRRDQNGFFEQNRRGQVRLRSIARMVRLPLKSGEFKEAVPERSEIKRRSYDKRTDQAGRL